MSRNQRIGLLAGAVVVAVVAFVIARSGGDDNDSNNASQPATTGSGADDGANPQIEETTTLHLTLKDAEVVGGVKTLTATKGNTVRIVISTDAPDEVHLHGYDIEKEANPGKPATLRFKADVEGAFELESHTAEHEGKEPLIARLHVEP